MNGAERAVRLTVTARSRSCAARVGVVETPSGAFDTPAFMPVGTQGTIKGLVMPLVGATGSQVILGNTYHLMLRPGAERVAALGGLGGLHRFMGWPGPILTDSGGFQAFSLSGSTRVTDDGVAFRSTVDGAEVLLSPERAVEVQNLLGADIIMAFDDCPPSVDPSSDSGARQRLRAWAGGGRRTEEMDHGARLDLANRRTEQWLERCARAHRRAADQALFAIVQGGTDLERRSRSARAVTRIDLPGYAIGGVAVGEGPEEIARVVRHTAPLLPDDRPRYLMGVGYERDIVAAVRAGVDMFDCVLPTRNGRSASAFTAVGQIRLRNAQFSDDGGPLDPGCDCLACRPEAHGWALPGGGCFSRAYLRHLFLADEMLGPILVSLHNVRHFQRLMVDIRAAIREDGWSALARRWPVLAGAEGSGAPDGCASIEGSAQGG